MSASDTQGSHKQQYPHTCPYNMVNFGLLAAEIGLPVWGTPPNFNGLRVLAALLHRLDVCYTSAHGVALVRI